MDDLPDVFFSADDGWAETRHVYLAGNGLPGRWEEQPSFVVSELGFGTGLNLVALMTLADDERRAGRAVPRLVYQSVEWRPRPRSDLEALAQRWPSLEPAVTALAAVYDPQPGWNLWSVGDLTLRLFAGDARLLPESSGFVPADAWFLDGYAPDRAPELWEPALLAWVGRATVPGGTAATYSAAGVVKQGLRAAGFAVTRAPGWGQKRHMVKAILSK
jgi:tRNA U34 5-methylaminomethyl-2-thiouridine-forming methyltransferase MnmC